MCEVVLYMVSGYDRTKSHWEKMVYCLNSLSAAPTPWSHGYTAASQVWKVMVSEDWSVSVILLFFKKGDRRSCCNYRGISLVV